VLPLRRGLVSHPREAERPFTCQDNRFHGNLLSVFIIIIIVIIITIIVIIFLIIIFIVIIIA
jgi:hypothetical protein